MVAIKLAARFEAVYGAYMRAIRSPQHATHARALLDFPFSQVQADRAPSARPVSLFRARRAAKSPGKEVLSIRPIALSANDTV